MTRDLRWLTVTFGSVVLCAVCLVSCSRNSAQHTAAETAVPNSDTSPAVAREIRRAVDAFGSAGRVLVRPAVQRVHRPGPAAARGADQLFAGSQ